MILYQKLLCSIKAQNSTSRPMVYKIHLLSTVALLLLGFLPLTSAHDRGSDVKNTIDMEASQAAQINSSWPSQLSFPTDSSASLQSYFSYTQASGLMLAHIVVMTVAWFFILPIGKYKFHTAES